MNDCRPPTRPNRSVDFLQRVPAIRVKHDDVNLFSVRLMSTCASKDRWGDARTFLRTDFVLGQFLGQLRPCDSAAVCPILLRRRCAERQRESARGDADRLDGSGQRLRREGVHYIRIQNTGAIMSPPGASALFQPYSATPCASVPPVKGGVAFGGRLATEPRADGPATTDDDRGGLQHGEGMLEQCAGRQDGFAVDVACRQRPSLKGAMGYRDRCLVTNAAPVRRSTLFGRSASS